MLSLCADVWLYRCAVSGRVESEFADSFGGGAEGTAALEGHRWSQCPSAQRLRLSGVAVLPEPRALLPHVRLTYTPFMFRVTIQDTLVLLDHSESALVRKVTWKCFFFFFGAVCYCCLHFIPRGGSSAYTTRSSWMTLSSASCSEQEVIAAVTVRALFHSFCLCNAAASAATFSHTHQKHKSVFTWEILSLYGYFSDKVHSSSNA